MDNYQPNFCFSTLALSFKYCEIAGNLAKDLEKFAPGITLVIATDFPQYFQQFPNVCAFKLKQQGILHCYNDKRFVIAKALSQFPTTILIDADTRIIDYIPQTININPGTIIGVSQNLIDHVQKYTPERLKSLQQVASKLDLSLEDAWYVGESLLIMTQDSQKEQQFIKYWGDIAQYLEMRGIHAGEGNIIGLAALKIGWKVEQTDSWNQLKKVTEHFDVSQKITRTTWESWQKRLLYHYRLNKARLLALKNFDFYYGNSK